jgi:hypothetical protein
MAITPTAFIAAHASGTNQTTYTTGGTGAPTGSALALVGVISRAASAGTQVTPTLTGGGITTWTQAATRLWDTTGSPTSQVTVFRAQEASPGSAAALVADFGAATQARCWIYSIQFTGVETGGTNGSLALAQIKVGSSDGTGLALTITLDNAISVGGLTGGFFYFNGNATATVGTGYTFLGNNITESTRASHEYILAGQTTVDMTWDTNNATRGGIAYEVREPISGLKTLVNGDIIRSLVNGGLVR